MHRNQPQRPLSHLGRFIALLAIVLLCILPHAVLSQQQQSSSSAPASASASSSAPARSTSTTAAPAATGTALPQTCSTADNCATYDGNCVQLSAGSQGFIRFSSPIATSVALVGNTFNISWTYDSVNTTQFPANQISLYYALTTSSVTGTTSTVTAATWYQHLVATLPPNAMSFNWTVPSLEAGQYKIRIVADRLDPDYATSLNQFQCIFPGQPIPTSSAAFRVLEAGELIPYTDKYPPNSAAAPGAGIKAPRSPQRSAAVAAGVGVAAGLGMAAVCGGGLMGL